MIFSLKMFSNVTESFYPIRSFYLRCSIFLPKKIYISKLNLHRESKMVPLKVQKTLY